MEGLVGFVACSVFCVVCVVAGVVVISPNDLRDAAREWIKQWEGDIKYCEDVFEGKQIELNNRPEDISDKITERSAMIHIFKHFFNLEDEE